MIDQAPLAQKVPNVKQQALKESLFTPLQEQQGDQLQQQEKVGGLQEAKL